MAFELILNRVVVVSRHVTPIPSAQVEAVEQDLGLALPSGYRAFMTRLGEGIYCDMFRIYPPSRIRDELGEQRAAWSDSFFEDPGGVRHWFFEGSEAILDAAALQECIALGDSIDGDVLAFHPARADRIFVLPRHSQLIEHARADLTDLHRWPGGKPRELTFQPFAEQATASFTSEQVSLDLAGFLARARGRWGDDGVLVTHERSDNRSWQTVFFVPAVGIRLQAVENEGVTHALPGRVASVTVQGSGERRLWISVSGDTEGIPNVRAFLDELDSAGLLKAHEA